AAIPAHPIQPNCQSPPHGHLGDLLAISWLPVRRRQLTSQSRDSAGPTAPINLAGAGWPRGPTETSTSTRAAQPAQCAAESHETYSVRSACAGEIALARKAGTTVAIRPNSPSTTAAVAN